MGFGCFSHCSQEEIDDFVAFVDKLIPATNPKWKIRKSSTESSTDDDKDKCSSA